MMHWSDITIAHFIQKQCSTVESHRRAAVKRGLATVEAKGTTSAPCVPVAGTLPYEISQVPCEIDQPRYGYQKRRFTLVALSSCARPLRSLIDHHSPVAIPSHHKRRRDGMPRSHRLCGSNDSPSQSKLNRRPS